MWIDQRFSDIWRPLKWFKSKEIGVRIEAEGRRKAQHDLNDCFKDTEEKVFACFISWRVMKNGYAMMCKKLWCRPGTINIDGKAEYSWRQAHALYLVRSAGVLWAAPTKSLLRNAITNNWAEHWSKNGQITRKDITKWFSNTTRSHVMKLVKETLEALNWDVLSRPLYSPNIVPSDYHLFRSMDYLSSASILMKIRKSRFVGSLKKCIVLRTWNSPITKKMRKSD